MIEYRNLRVALLGAGSVLLVSRCVLRRGLVGIERVLGSHGL